MLQTSIKLISFISLAFIMQSCNTPVPSGQTVKEPAAFGAFSQTAPSLGNSAASAVIWQHPTDSSKNLILSSDETVGIDVLTLKGKRLGQFPLGKVESLDLQNGFSIGGRNISLIAALDTQNNIVKFITVDDQIQELQDRTGQKIQASFPTKGICLYKSPLTKSHYVFIVGEEGYIEQWVIYGSSNGTVDGRLVRTLRLGSEVGYCTADDKTGTLYASEEATGIWKIKADPETDSTPEIIDVIKFGHITEEVAGLSIYHDQKGHDYLVASNASANDFNLYDINADHSFIGSFAINNVEETAGIFISSNNLGKDMEQGALIVADDDNGELGLNYKILSWNQIQKEFNLPTEGTAKKISNNPIRTVVPTVETDPVGVAGDAADDPAIWVHPEDSAKSTIIATDKKSGLYVYGLDGKTLQFIKDGRVNNVDVRYGFTLGSEKVDIVTASNRTKKSISIFKVDPKTGLLTDISDGIQDSGLNDPYGFCMYHSKKTGKYYAFVNGDEGIVKQMELIDTGKGRVSLTLVREFNVGSQTEGCVADDDTAIFYIGEEDVAIWKYGAEPETGDKRSLVSRGTDHENIEVDIEGLSLYYGANGTGYLIASSQGNNSYAVFRREGNNEYIGSFAVVANGPLGIDGSSETDGLDVISTPLGDKFPYGLFIAQDGRNISPAENQNFKLVPWENIANQLALEKHTGWQPRQK